MIDVSIADDWRLDVDGESLSFGAADSPIVLEAAPDVSDADRTVRDSNRSRGDGRRMGRDDRGGTTLSFELTVVQDVLSATREHVGAFRRLWRGDEVRDRAGVVASLTAPTGRTAFGRPRGLIGDDRLIQDAIADLTATFDTVDDRWYGAEEETTVAFAVVPSGGLVAPLRAPLSTTRTSDRSQVVTIGGELPTPVVFEVAGPITNPAVLIGPLQFHFATSLAYDEVLRYDGRSWVRTIRREGARSGSLAGSVTSFSTRLLDAVLPPGTYDVALRGMSPTATAALTIRHRPAFGYYY